MVQLPGSRGNRIARICSGPGAERGHGGDLRGERDRHSAIVVHAGASDLESARRWGFHRHVAKGGGPRRVYRRGKRSYSRVTTECSEVAHECLKVGHPRRPCPIQRIVNGGTEDNGVPTRDGRKRGGNYKEDPNVAHDGWILRFHGYPP